jgi:hypothetical protein
MLWKCEEKIFTWTSGRVLYLSDNERLDWSLEEKRPFLRFSFHPRSIR